MYILEDMIDLGLPEGGQWPKREAYRVVAQNVCLCNSLVTNRDTLMEMVGAILAIPETEIEQVTLVDLASKYQVPNIRLS